MSNKINFSEIFNKELKEFFKPWFKAKKQTMKPTPPKRRTGLKVNRSWLVGIVLLFFVFGFLGGLFCLTYLPEQLSKFSPQLKEYFTVWKEKQEKILQPAPGSQRTQITNYVPQTSQEEAIIAVVREASPSVVSIVITKEVPVYEQYYEKPFDDFFGGESPLEIEIEIPRYRQKGTEKKKIGGGTGFIVSKDGMVLTNKHVVADKEADFTVITNEGEKYPTEVLALDPLQDLAILKIEMEKEITGEGAVLPKPFPVLKLGDSSKLQIGQTVIAIGNALGEFRNTVSVGVISGLGRSVVATGGGVTETLEDVIQTDAAINLGNSGGPLLNLRGEVIGVNVAMAEAAQSIGFSISIDLVKASIEKFKKYGKIIYPFLGIVYTLVNPELEEERGLSVDYGAMIVDDDKVSVVPGSAADKAGLKKGDIILEVDEEKITQQNPLSKIIKRHLPDDKIVLKVLRGEETLTIEAVLGEISSEESS